MKILKLIKAFGVWCGLMGAAFIISCLGLFFLDVPSGLPLWRMACGIILLIIGFKISVYKQNAHE